MKKKNLYIIGFAVCLPIVILGGICLLDAIYVYNYKGPVRPECVPAEAKWVGGVDGGYYYDLKSDYSDTSHFVIYDDFSGEIVYDGLFVCEGDFEEISNKDWRDLIDFYDGEKLITKGSGEKCYILWTPIEVSEQYNE